MATRLSAKDVAKSLNDLSSVFCKEDNDAIDGMLAEYFCYNSDEESSSESEEEESEQFNDSVQDVGPLVHSPAPSCEDESDEEDDNQLDLAPLVQTAPVNIQPDVDTEAQKERQIVTDFLKAGCGCSFHNDGPCSARYTEQYILDYRAQCLEVTRENLDMVIIGQLAATLRVNDTRGVDSKHPSAQRVRKWSQYMHQGWLVCIRTFRLIHAIGDTRLKNIKKSFTLNGIAPRVHGNAHRKPKHALTYEDQCNVVSFLTNYCEAHGLLLPGRVPGYRRTDIKLLPSSVTKRGIWTQYQTALQHTGEKAVAYTTFCLLWRTLVPSIVVMKPMTDLCWTCQQHGNGVLRATLTTELKQQAMQAYVEHLRLVAVERSVYTESLQRCKESVYSHYSVNGVMTPPPLGSRVPANSIDIEAHYSFDFAQQVHYPSNPLQPGPVYFLTPRKCSIFGVHCEAFPRQVNFLCDEAGDCGKGANTVISLLHYYFENHGLGEMSVHLHADNCVGQNKNNFVLWYLMWRVLTGRHNKITLSFLVVGHTKFSPDWCFGLFKRLYRRTFVGSLQAIAEVVEKSGRCNTAQLVVDQDGTVIVPNYDWVSFLCPHFSRLRGIKKGHHFVFDSIHPGEVLVKATAEQSNSTWQTLLREPFRGCDLPEQIEPAGMSAQRKWYLYDKIREFCPDDAKDTTCPMPACPKPNSRHVSPAPSTISSPEPQPKRKRHRK